MVLSLRFIFMLLYTPAACVTALRRPYLGLLALVAMYYFRPSIWHAPLWFRPILWITICVAIGWALKARRFRFSGIITLGLMTLLAFLASALMAAVSVETAIGGVWILAKVIVVGFLTLQLVDTPKKINMFLWTNVLGMLWNIKTILVLGLFHGGVTENVRVDVGVGQGGGSNYLAMILVMTIPFFLLKFLNGARWERRFATIMGPVYVLCVVLTGSRGGFLALFLTSLYVVLRSRRKALGVAALVACGLIFVAAMPKAQWQRFETGFKSGDKRDYSATSRILLWKAAWTMFKESPVLGKGIDNFQLLSPRYAGFYAGNTIKAYQSGVVGRGFVAHSTWFQTLAEGGLAAALPFFGIFFLVFVTLARVRRLPIKNRAMRNQMRDNCLILEGLFVAFLVASTFGSHLKIDFLWWYLGLVSALAFVAEEQARKPGPPRQIPSQRRQTLSEPVPY